MPVGRLTRHHVQSLQWGNQKVFKWRRSGSFELNSLNDDFEHIPQVNLLFSLFS